MRETLSDITCVIPTFRRPHYLDRALKSILNQTMWPSRVIVSENGEEVENSRIVKKYIELGLTIDLLTSTVRLPAHKNWYRAFNECNTELIKIVWDDDWLEDDCLETLRGWMTRTGARVVLCGAFGCIGEKKMLWYQHEKEEILATEVGEIFEDITRRRIPNSPLAGLHYTVDVIAAMNYKNYPISAIRDDLVVGPDFAMNLWGILNKGKLYFNPKPLVNMFSDGSNMTRVFESELSLLYKQTIKNLTKDFNVKLSAKNRLLLHLMEDGLNPLHRKIIREIYKRKEIMFS